MLPKVRRLLAGVLLLLPAVAHAQTGTGEQAGPPPPAPPPGGTPSAAPLPPPPPTAPAPSPSASSADRLPTPAPGAKVVSYKSFSVESPRPTISLSSNSDGSATAKANANITMDFLSGGPAANQGTSIFSLTVAPTFAVTESGKAGVLSIGAKAGAAATPPSFGATSLTGGLMVAYSLESSLSNAEGEAWLTQSWSQIQPAQEAALTACKAIPRNTVGAPADVVAFWTEYDKHNVIAPGAGDQADRWNYAQLCNAGKTQWAAKAKSAAAMARLWRYQFPILDISVWGGGGASQFSYYDADATGTYSSTTNWKPNAGVAVQFTALTGAGVEPDDARGVGWTFEVDSFLKAAYEASTTTGQPCASRGPATGGATLSSCGPVQPIGAPSSGTSVTAEGYVGWYDRSNNAWRVAVGGGILHDAVTGLDTWSVKVPVYINGSAFGSSASSSSSSGGNHSGASSGSAPANPTASTSPVELDYNGIIRVTPTLQLIPVSGESLGWAFLVNFELLGQRNLFVRADSLVK